MHVWPLRTGIEPLADEGQRRHLLQSRQRQLNHVAQHVCWQAVEDAWPPCRFGPLSHVSKHKMWCVLCVCLCRERETIQIKCQNTRTNHTHTHTKQNRCTNERTDQQPNRHNEQHHTPRPEDEVCCRMVYLFKASV